LIPINLVLTPPDLVEHPQLAAVELLRTALNLTKTALLAAHPELTVEDFIPGSNDGDILIAEHVLNVISDLLPVLDAYKEALPDPGDRYLDVPF
jgi:hypothetical protein